MNKVEPLPKCCICKEMIKLNDKGKIKYPKTVKWDGWYSVWTHNVCKELQDQKLFDENLKCVLSILTPEKRKKTFDNLDC